jgi:hypothetical protein
MLAHEKHTPFLSFFFLLIFAFDPIFTAHVHVLNPFSVSPTKMDGQWTVRRFRVRQQRHHLATYVPVQPTPLLSYHCYFLVEDPIVVPPSSPHAGFLDVIVFNLPYLSLLSCFLLSLPVLFWGFILRFELCLTYISIHPRPARSFLLRTLTNPTYTRIVPSTSLSLSLLLLLSRISLVLPIATVHSNTHFMPIPGLAAPVGLPSLHAFFRCLEIRWIDRLGSASSSSLHMYNSCTQTLLRSFVFAAVCYLSYCIVCMLVL